MIQHLPDTPYIQELFQFAVSESNKGKLAPSNCIVDILKGVLGHPLEHMSHPEYSKSFFEKAKTLAKEKGLFYESQIPLIRKKAEGMSLAMIETFEKTNNKTSAENLRHDLNQVLRNRN